MAVVGRIARAHGNRGQVIVDPSTDFPEERFKAGSILFVRRGAAAAPVTVESVRFHRGRPIVGLAEVRTMNEAEELAGAELRVSADSLVPLPAGSYYHHDLIGCSVESAGGEKIGLVKAVEGDREGSRLVIEGTSGDVLVPMVEGICGEIDLRGKRIVVTPPDGLLDLNVTKRQRF